MSKLPSLQFYPADWRKDPAVQSLDYHDRGVWFEMLCLMHESDERGKLMLNGAKMPESALARLLGLDKQILTTTLTTLLTYGVARVEEETGVIYSKRMVEDEHLRQVRTEAGKKGGNPALVKQKTTTGVKQKTTPSSSSSSSSSSSEDKELDVSEGPKDQDPLSLSPSSPNADTMSGRPRSTPPPNPEIEIYLGAITAGVMRELNLTTVRGMGSQKEWHEAGLVALENEFSSAQFLECFALLRGQAWRTSAVKPKQIIENLPNLSKLRLEAKAKSTPTVTTSYAHVSGQPTQREAIRAEEARIAQMEAVQ